VKENSFMKNVQTQMEPAKQTTKIICPGIKRRISTLVVVAATISAFSTAALAERPVIPFLPSPQNISTVPPNGDQNPYGVAFVPRDFKGNGGPLQPGDILVSNFNNSDNKQGTGTTIVRIGADGSFSTFFAGPPHPTGSSGFGLSTALAVLRKGFVIVGNVPSMDGTIATSGPGSLLVIDNKGNLLSMISDATINGPWDMTVDDRGGDNVTAFVSNAFAGTVVRLNLHLTATGITVMKKTVIASGYQHQGDAVTFVDGPTGLVYDADHDTLFVASTVDNAVYAVQNAEKTTTNNGTGNVIYSDNTHLHGALGMVMAPNGHLLVTNNDVINSDPTQPSEIVEFTVTGQFVTQLSVDPSQGGSFGLAVNVQNNIATFAAVDDNTASLLIWTLAVPH
jgi:hypothetical protein